MSRSPTSRRRRAVRRGRAARRGAGVKHPARWVALGVGVRRGGARCGARAQRRDRPAGRVEDVASARARRRRPSTSSISRATPVTSDSLAGKTVIVNFWNEWCAPCLQELPGAQGVLAGARERRRRRDGRCRPRLADRRRRPWRATPTARVSTGRSRSIPGYAGGARLRDPGSARDVRDRADRRDRRATSSARRAARARGDARGRAGLPDDEARLAVGRARRCSWSVVLAVALWPQGEPTPAERAHSIAAGLKCQECQGLSVADSNAATSKAISERHQASGSRRARATTRSASTTSTSTARRSCSTRRARGSACSCGCCPSSRSSPARRGSCSCSRVTGASRGCTRPKPTRRSSSASVSHEHEDSS